MKVKLIKRRECVRLTWTGRFFVLLFLGMVLLLFFKRVHVFLAVNNPVDADILVVDGFLPGYAYDSIQSLVVSNTYKLVLTTGVDIDYTFTSDDAFNTADFSYKVLSSKSLGECRLERAPAGRINKDRTFHSALSAREWLNRNGYANESLNVFSMGGHARRSWLLYRKAFGEEREIGIIALEDQSYDSKSWYNHSKGVRLVMSEFIAFAYAKFFFFPDKEMLKRNKDLNGQ